VSFGCGGITKFNPDSQVDTGMGIGMGVVIDGRIFHGSHNQAGELRSVYWKTACGTENQVSIPQSRLAGIQHDETVLKDLVKEVLINLIPIASVFDPEAIIFGGDLKGKIDVIREVLRESLSDTFLASEQSKYVFVAPNTGDNEVSTGAASLFLYRLFKQPQDESELSEKSAWEQIYRLKEIP
jgi:predicted NBD/HSP70 family sugar kinase